MKKSPDRIKLEEMLRNSKISLDGFMGSDTRELTAVIDEDAADLAERGITIEQLTEKMEAITAEAIAGLGNWVTVSDNLEAMTKEAKGTIPCPWPHTGRFAKRVTIVKNISTDQTIQWSDLNIHLIEAHGFFEGKGAAFRVEPNELVKLLF